MVLVGIVDNNMWERSELKRQIVTYMEARGELCVVHEFSDGVEFIRSPEKYNLIFLEMYLNGGMSGLEAAQFSRIVNKAAQIIFVTHSKEMAIRGYEVDAVDYLIKPVADSTMEKTLEKAMAKMQKSFDTAFVLKTTDGLYSISSNEIRFVEVYDHELIYHTDRGEFVVRGNLKEVGKKLEKYQFVQMNRSYLVNMRHIRSINKNYVMVGDTQIQIAKSRQKEVETRFIAYVGVCI